MFRYKILTVFLFLILLDATLAIEINSCRAISAPGNYVLTNDIVGAPTQIPGSNKNSCITISAVDNVNLDCQNQSISANGSGLGKYGAYIKNSRGLRLTKCQIAGYETGVFVDRLDEGYF